MIKKTIFMSIIIAIILIAQGYGANQNRGDNGQGDTDRIMNQSQDQDCIYDCDSTPDRDRNRTQDCIDCENDQIQEREQDRDRNYTNLDDSVSTNLMTDYTDEEWDRIKDRLQNQNHTDEEWDQIRDRIRNQDSNDFSIIQDQDQIRDRDRINNCTDCDNLYDRDRDRVRAASFTIIMMEKQIGDSGDEFLNLVSDFDTNDQNIVQLQNQINNRNRIIKFFAGGDRQAAMEMEQYVLKNEYQLQQMYNFLNNCNCTEQTKQEIRNQLLIMEQDRFMHKNQADNEKENKGLLGWIWK